jgi:hypothetical protein
MFRNLLGALLLITACVSGWRVPPPAVTAACSRRAMLPAAVGLAFSGRLPAGADDKSKYDKKFQACLSQCVYEQMKISKGIAEVELISQKDAIASCKPKCAKSKEQLLTGAPK